MSSEVSSEAELKDAKNSHFVEKGKWLFVSNLSWKAKEKDLIDLFSQSCTVVDATIEKKKGSQSRGFGYVCVPTEEEGRKATEALQGALLLDRPLIIEKALKKPKRQKKKKVKKKNGKQVDSEKKMSFNVTSNNMMEGKRKRRRIDVSGVCIRALHAITNFHESLKDEEPQFRKLRQFWKDLVCIGKNKNSVDSESRLALSEMFPLLKESLILLAKNSETREGYSRESPFALVKRSMERLFDLQIIDLQEQHKQYVHSLVELGFQIECQNYSNNFENYSNEIKLENKILELFEKRKNPSEEILQQRKEIVDLISNCVQTHFGENAKLCIFGSSTTPLQSSTSDLDLGIKLPGVGREICINKEYAISLLKPFQQHLFESKIPNKAVFLTRIPLIRLKNVQISTEICLFDEFNELKADYIRKICEISPLAGPFLTFIKFWAKARSLSNPRHAFGQGGCTSFGFVCLGIINLVQNELIPNINQYNLFYNNNNTKQQQNNSINNTSSSSTENSCSSSSTENSFNLQPFNSLEEQLISFFFNDGKFSI